MAPDAHGAIDAVWRIESARLIAGLARMVRDVGLAEDLAQDALVAALEQWPSLTRRAAPRLAHRPAVKDEEHRGDEEEDRLIERAGDWQEPETCKPAKRLRDAPIAGQGAAGADRAGDELARLLHHITVRKGKSAADPNPSRQ